jgi:hypothetical protein
MSDVRVPKWKRNYLDKGLIPREYYFPTSDVFYSQLSKNASTTLLTMFMQLEGHDITHVWDQRIIRRKYRADKQHAAVASSRIKLLVLRNPARRIMSAWLDKFFMVSSSVNLERWELITSGDVEAATRMEESFSRFLDSLLTEPKNLEVDIHLFPQSRCIRDLSFYTHIVGMKEVSELPNALGLVRTSEQVKHEPRAAIKNSTPANVFQALSTSDNLAKIEKIYHEDFEVIRRASAKFSALSVELEGPVAAQGDVPQEIPAATIGRLVASRERHYLRASRRKLSQGRHEAVRLYLLCHNEEVLIAHTINHYRRNIPQVQITILDNESSDDSVAIAVALGCSVIPWASGGQIDDFKYVELKNTVWRSVEEGWVIVADMDEWLCATASDLQREARLGVTVLKTYGWNIVAESSREDLGDLDLHALTQGFYQKNFSKLVAFRRPHVRAMNYTLGAHAALPSGEIVYSPRIYVLKHMERLGLPWLTKKFKNRYARSARMHEVGVARHYTDDLAEIAERQSSAVSEAIERTQWVIPANRNRQIAYLKQRIKVIAGRIRR